MAAERRGGAAAHHIAVSMADGGTERGAAKGTQDSVWVEHCLIEEIVEKAGILPSFVV